MFTIGLQKSLFSSRQCITSFLEDNLFDVALFSIFGFLELLLKQKASLFCGIGPIILFGRDQQTRHLWTTCLSLKGNNVEN